MNPFKIYGVEVINNALKIDDTLIISDLHLGYESSLNKQGLMIPQFQYDKIIDSLDEIQKRASTSNIILNGDIKHDFGNINKQEWKEVLDFIDYLSDEFINIEVIRGNHDKLIEPILNKRNLRLKDNIVLNNYLICHGDKIPLNIPEDVDTIIIGHEHPCIGISSGRREEKFKSYLKGSWENYNLIIMPSFNHISQGSDILSQKTISPFIKDVNNFEVYAIDNHEIYPFGLVSDILSVQEERLIK